MEKSFAAQYAQLERRHYWHLARRRITTNLLRHYAQRGSNRPLKLLDAGCGAGTNLRHLSKDYQCLGIEPDPILVLQAKQSGVKVLQAKLPLSPGVIREKFDFILLLDVLEHIEDDVEALRSLRHLLKPHGKVVINVPAHPALWSVLDEVNHHFRRYTRQSFQQVVHKSGFKFLEMRYWGTIGWPLIYLQRKILWSPRRQEYKTYIPRPFLNQTLLWSMMADYYLTALLNLPFGVSISAVIEPRKNK